MSGQTWMYVYGILCRLEKDSLGWCTGLTGIPFRAEPFGWNLDRPALSDAKSDGAVAPASSLRC